MQRVLIVGPAGSGKSRLASSISRRAGLPLVHLDVLFWDPGWIPAPHQRALKELRSAVAGDRWILDGNFLASREQDGRFARADTVVFLDLPRTICFARIFWRLMRDRRRSRPDLPEGCRESFDPTSLREVWSYRRDERPLVFSILAGLGPDTAVHHLRSPSEVKAFFSHIPSQR
jgi:adenylate kinase family enzyme